MLYSPHTTSSQTNMLYSILRPQNLPKTRHQRQRRKRETNSLMMTTPSVVVLAIMLHGSVLVCSPTPYLSHTALFRNTHSFPSHSSAPTARYSTLPVAALRGLVIVEPKDGDNLKDKRQHAIEARALKCLLPDLPSQMPGLRYLYVPKHSISYSPRCLPDSLTVGDDDSVTLASS